MSPVDTKPLNRTRRAMLLLFMLVLFLAALGTAKMIVSERTRTVSKGFFFDIPAGFEEFKVVQQTPHVPVLACGNARGDRQFILFQLPIRGQLAKTDPLDHAQMIYRTYMQANPIVHAETRINRFPAERLSGPVGKGFGIISASVVDGRLVAVLYHGGTAMTEQDEAIFRELTEESITFFGQLSK